MRKTFSALVAFSVLAMPVAASAQFGGLAKKALGGGSSGSSVSKGDADGFLNGAVLSTKNVMISAQLLADALRGREDMAAQKAEIASISESKDIGAVNASKERFKSDLAVLSASKDLSGDIQGKYASASSAQKERIAKAVANLALGAYRNVGLAGQAPGMISGVGSNPQLMKRVGDFKTAGSLLSMQASAFTKIAPALPKVMTALKIKPLPEAETTEPRPITFAAAE
ncbi:hypothetical conserved protein [Novosphingobium sp. MBES04]|nr:hypothetical conserved protein [Novosphingobium sp. MBES04]